MPLAQNNRNLLLQSLALVLAGFAIYFRPLTGTWLWDDEMIIVDNPDLRDLTGLWHLWTSVPVTDYWPLTWTLLWIEWHLWGTFAPGYHLVSLALHLTSGFLVWRLLEKLGLRWAWLGGFFFVVHPLAVESVAWASEIKNTFSLPLFLMALLYWLQEKRSPVAYVASIAWYLAAMLAKTSVIMLPAVCLLHAWWRNGRITIRDLVRLVPFALIALVLGLITIHFQAHRTAAVEASGHGPVALICLAAANVFFYLGKFAWPFGLLPIYPIPPFDPPSWLQMASVPFLLAMIAGLWLRRRGWGRHALLGFGYFLINLLPVLGFVPMAYLSISRVADHFVYLPLVGLTGLTALGFQSLYDRRGAIPRAAALNLTAAVAAAWLVIAHLYAGIFVNRETLWGYTLARNPAASLGRLEYANILRDRGDLTGALQQLQLGLQIMPHNVALNAGLGDVLWKLGRSNESLAYYDAALRAEPDMPPCRLNRGALRQMLGDPAGAIQDLQRCIELVSNDNHADYARLLIWIARVRMNDRARADSELADALAKNWIDPADAPSACEAQFLLGRIDDAHLLASAARSPAALGEAHYYIGVKRLLAGDKPGAIDQFRQCVATGQMGLLEYDLAQGELARLSVR